MGDLENAVAIGFSGFFAALAIVLLARYRQISQRISSSSDLGRDLWTALDERLKKQDERILEMMGRVDAMQSRWSTLGSLPGAPLSDIEIARPSVSRVSEAHRSEITVKGRPSLDSTEKSVAQLIGQKPRTSVEIKELIGKSREHTARLMKVLFDRGYVTRDVTKRPFVYQLTEAGRDYLSAT